MKARVPEAAPTAVMALAMHCMHIASQSMASGDRRSTFGEAVSRTLGTAGDDRSAVSATAYRGP